MFKKVTIKTLKIKMNVKKLKNGIIWEEKIALHGTLAMAIALPAISLIIFLILGRENSKLWLIVILGLSALAYFYYRKIKSELTRVTYDGLSGKFANLTDYSYFDLRKILFSPNFISIKFGEIDKIIKYHECDDVEARPGSCSWRVDIRKKNGKIINLYLSDIDGFKNAMNKAGLKFRGIKVEYFTIKLS